MCELLGMSFNLPVRPKISFRKFRQRDEENPDGWGLAFYPDSSAQIFKEPLKATKSDLSGFLKDYPEVRSKLIIGHVRKTAQGSISHRNTQPFSRELNRREYVFAHNGRRINPEQLGLTSLELGRFQPIGETGSEHAFCHLLKCIEERNIKQWKENDFPWLAQKLREMNKYAALNVVFSDSLHLFCYHDKDCYKGLHLLQRKAPYHTFKLSDKDWNISFPMTKDPNQYGYIIATQPLTGENWKPFAPGELIVFRNGELIYSSLTRDPVEIKVLTLLRSSEHRLSLQQIIQNLQYSRNKTIKAVQSLLNKRLIKQDGRDIVNWNNGRATFYTVPERRREIDKLCQEKC